MGGEPIPSKPPKQRRQRQTWRGEHGSRETWGRMANRNGQRPIGFTNAPGFAARRISSAWPPIPEPALSFRPVGKVCQIRLNVTTGLVDTTPTVKRLLNFNGVPVSHDFDSFPGGNHGVDPHHRQTDGSFARPRRNRGALPCLRCRRGQRSIGHDPNRRRAFQSPRPRQLSFANASVGEPAKCSGTTRTATGAAATGGPATGAPESASTAIPNGGTGIIPQRPHPTGF